MIACRKGGPAALEPSPKPDPAGNGGKVLCGAAGPRTGPSSRRNPALASARRGAPRMARGPGAANIARSWVETQYV